MKKVFPWLNAIYISYCFTFSSYLFSSTTEQTSYTTLLIKIPTREREAQFFRFLDEYYKKLSGEISYHFLISCDVTDPVMNCQEVIEKLNSYPNLSYYFGQNKSKVEAYNSDIDKHPNFDILIVASDDMAPIMQDYDKIIVSSMQKYFPDFDGVLHFSDGVQKSNLNTLPILGSTYYRRFGYVYHPDYLAFFCDNEFDIVSQKLRKVIYFDQVLIEHFHYLVGKGPNDELYQRNDKLVGTDEITFYNRARKHFDLPDDIYER